MRSLCDSCFHVDRHFREFFVWRLFGSIRDRCLAYRSRIMPSGPVRFLASANYSLQWTPCRTRKASMLQHVLGNLVGNIEGPGLLLGLAHVVSYHDSMRRHISVDDHRGAQVL